MLLLIPYHFIESTLFRYTSFKVDWLNGDIDLFFTNKQSIECSNWTIGFEWNFVQVDFKSKRKTEVESNTMGDLRLTKGIFGHLEDGSVVDLYTLRNRNGVEVGITTFGGAITFLKVPDNKGNIKDVVLGFDKLEDYVKGLK